MQKISHIGKYDIVGEIGNGGMGIVYQAYDPFKDRFVALKIPKLGHINENKQSFEQLFYNEVNAASRLHHPNIIDVYDAGVANGPDNGDVHYIAMEYIPGGTTLKRFCQPDNLLPIELVGGMLLKCAEAFDYAHRHGVMHRDIKPGNILLKDEREIKISDFGLAMLMDPDMVDTHSMTPMGSPRYMAPERLREEGTTHRSDIYSLGVVMYELLTGHTPFTASHLTALLQQIVDGKVSPPSNFRPNLPPALDGIVFKAMARKPADRYASMMDFAADLSICFSDLNATLDGPMTELRTEQLKQLAFFSRFNDAEIWELLRWSEWLDIPEQGVVIQEGDYDDVVYLLVKGKVAVYKDNTKVTTLGRGELLGEIAFLGRQRRSASVIAEQDITLLKLNIKQLEQASKSSQIQFQRVFISTLIERLVKTTEQLARLQQ